MEVKSIVEASGHVKIVKWGVQLMKHEKEAQRGSTVCRDMPVSARTQVR